MRDVNGIRIITFDTEKNYDKRKFIENMFVLMKFFKR